MTGETSTTTGSLYERVAELEVSLARVTAERDRLRAAYERVKIDLELLRRRLFIAKAERIDTAQLELEFAEKLAELDAVVEKLAPTAQSADRTSADAPAPGASPPPQKPRPRPTGRRNLHEQALPEERVEVLNPAFEGTVQRIGWEQSSRVVWRRGGFVRLLTLRAKYEPAGVAARDQRAAAADGELTTHQEAQMSSSESDHQEPEVATPSPSPSGHPVTVEAAAADVPQSPSIPQGGAATRTAAARRPIPPELAAEIAEKFKDGPIYTVPMPPMLLPRSIATPSLLAHIISEKFCDGLPLYRQEQRSARLGFRIDRGTMSRWIEEVGGIVGATVVHAMRLDAMANAFCIATDATGILVQPIREGPRKRSPCRRGHYFVQIADRDHVFFEYTPRETSAAVSEMFRGFSGYVQADAKSVYDLLFRPPDQQRPLPYHPEPDQAIRHEVACWSHGRRGFWEAAIFKDPVAREALARIKRIFEIDALCRERPTPEEVCSLRQTHLRPHLDAFFAWAADEYAKVQDRRGLLRSAFGYVIRQKAALLRFLDDGRLIMDNNRSERELRRVAVGRKAWLFVGSDDHAEAAGNHLTLIASARLHGLDPETYLRDLYRVLPHWPRERFLELCPRDWPATRARLDPAQLEAELGPLTIPPPLAAPEQSSPR